LGVAETTGSIEKRIANLEFKVKVLTVLIVLLLVALVLPEEVRVVMLLILLLLGTITLFVWLCERHGRTIPQ